MPKKQELTPIFVIRSLAYQADDRKKGGFMGKTDNLKTAQAEAGENMVRTKYPNLKPVQTKDEARERGKAGGIASGAARRKKRDLRIALLALMDEKVGGKTGIERIAAALFQKALEGDVKAIMAIQGQVLAGNSLEADAELGIEMF